METQSNQPSQKASYASLRERVQALMMDGAIMLVIAYFTFSSLDNMGLENSELKPYFYFFLFFLYDPLLIAFTGGTIGHKMMEIKVKDATDNSKNINLFMAFMRFAVKILLGWMSLLSVTANDERKAIHDFTGNSVVLKHKRRK